MGELITKDIQEKIDKFIDKYQKYADNPNYSVLVFRASISSPRYMVSCYNRSTREIIREYIDLS